VPGIDAHHASPGALFHRTYTPLQADALADALADRRELPQEFTYLGSGAEIWRQTDEGLAGDRSIRAGEQPGLLSGHAPGLLARLPQGAPVEVIDLGPGTGGPARALIGGLVEADRFAGYRAIEFSGDLLDLARRNLHGWFPGLGGRLEFRHGDFTGPELAGLLAPRPAGPPRFVLLIGGTLLNLAEPEPLLRRIAAALSPDDVLLVTVRFDNGVNRPPFVDRPEIGRPLPPILRAAVDLLDIDPGWYGIERDFDPDRREIRTVIRFRRPVTVHIDGARGRRTVGFDAGEPMLVYRYRFLDESGVVSLLAGCGLRTRMFVTGGSGEVALVAAGSAAR
jgi:SAM-dependent methyltransferase